MWGYYQSTLRLLDEDLLGGVGVFSGTTISGVAGVGVVGAGVFLLSSVLLPVLPPLFLVELPLLGFLADPVFDFAGAGVSVGSTVGSTVAVAVGMGFFMGSSVSSLEKPQAERNTQNSAASVTSMILPDFIFIDLFP